MLGWMRRLLVDDPRTREELEAVPLLRQQVAELTEDLEERTGERDALTGAVDSYRERQAELSRRLTAAELDRDTARTELTAARGQVEDLTTRLDATSAELARAQRCAAMRGEAFDRANDDAVALAAERDQLRVTVETITGHARLIDSSLVYARNRVETLLAQLNAAPEAKS